MARPNNPNDPNARHLQKQAEPEQDQAQEQEEEVQKDANESEQKQNTQQNTLGNQAIQNQMITGGQAAPGGDGGGGGLAMRKAGQESDKDYGGDGDVDDDLPLTLEDLVRSWNPGTNKSEDRPSWLEPMPGDELPPEDEAFLASVRTEGVHRVRGDFTIDSQLQPSRTVVAASLMDWGRAVQGWCGTGLLDSTLARTFVPGASFLHDPWGRVLLNRVRTGAVGTLLVQRGPTLTADRSSPTLGFLTFCLELQGHRRHAEMVRIDPGVEGKQMPKTTAVLERSFQAPPARVQPRELPAEAGARLAPVLDILLDLEDPEVYLPSMIAEIPEDDADEDPLGLDAILAQFTGGGPDPDEPLYYAAMQAAERLAAATARTRIHVAAAAVALAQVSRMWSAGPPMDTLGSVAVTVDQETDKNLRLLVEIARAAQRKSVPPKGLKAGLKRAVRALRTVHELAHRLLAETAGGIVPGNPRVAVREAPPRTPIDEAWADGEPQHALAWLRSLPDTPENRATTLLVELEAGRAATGVGPLLLEAAASIGDPVLAEVVRVFAGPCLLLGERYDDALALGRAQMELGESRRNGMLLANGTLLGVEALRAQGDPDAADALRLEGGRRAWAIGAPGALSVLARWTPPEEELSQAV